MGPCDARVSSASERPKEVFTPQNQINQGVWDWIFGPKTDRRPALVRETRLGPLGFQRGTLLGIHQRLRRPAEWRAWLLGACEE